MKTSYTHLLLQESSDAHLIHPDKHFAICRAEVSKSELDPDEGLYEPVSSDFWRASINVDGAIEDYASLRRVSFNIFNYYIKIERLVGDILCRC
jgi:hypothetical protein